MPNQDIVVVESPAILSLNLVLPEPEQAFTITGGFTVSGTVLSSAIINTSGISSATNVQWASVSSTSSFYEYAGATSSVYHNTLATTGSVIWGGTSTNVIGGWDGNIFVNGTSGPIAPLTPADLLLIEARDRERIRARRVEVKTAKGAIKRAIKLMSGLGYEPEINIFLRGETVEVSHADSDLKFLLKKYGNSLIDRTIRPGYSTPYQLQLYTKTDIHLADLCVYMEKTPVIDQVLGLVMFIRSGSEEAILKKANFSCRTQDEKLKEALCTDRPYLADKLNLGSSGGIYVTDPSVCGSLDTTTVSSTWYTSCWVPEILSNRVIGSICTV